MEDTTMKKTYINPNIEVVKMQMNQHLLDASTGLSNSSASVSGGTYNNSLGHDDDFDW